MPKEILAKSKGKHVEIALPFLTRSAAIYDFFLSACHLSLSTNMYGPLMNANRAQNVGTQISLNISLNYTSNDT